MHLQSLKDGELLERTLDLSREERRITSSLIEHLREVNRRKLYCDIGCGSLFQYCIRILKMSEGSAQRRIDAMRLTEALPEVKAKIESGELTLSVASRVQTFARMEPQAPLRELVRAVEGRSFRDAEKELLKLSSVPERHTPERVRQVAPALSSITVHVTDEQLARFEAARAKLAHINPQLSWIELFDELAKRFLKEPAPRRSASPTVGNGRRPSAGLKREVTQRDGERCMNCGSAWALELDHKTPWAFGGQTTAENLRVLCRNCNQRAAIKAFGRKDDRLLP